METMLIILLAVAAPYPGAGIVFGAVLAFTFYAAAIVVAVSQFTPGRPVGRA